MGEKQTINVFLLVKGIFFYLVPSCTVPQVAMLLSYTLNVAV